MSYISQCITDGAVAFCALGEAVTTNGSAAADSTANASPTYSGTGWTGGFAGIPGAPGITAAKNTDASSFVSIPSVAANITVNIFSYEFWFSPSAYPVATTWSLFGVNDTLVRLDPSGLFRLTKQAVSDVILTTTPIPIDSTLHHIVIAKSGPTRNCYLDSVDITSLGTDEIMSSSSGNPYEVGKDPIDGAALGTYAMAAVYNVYLSPAKVSSHFQLGSTVPTTAVTVAGPPPLLGRMGR